MTYKDIQEKFNASFDDLFKGAQEQPLKTGFKLVIFVMVVRWIFKKIF